MSERIIAKIEAQKNNKYVIHEKEKKAKKNKL